MAKQTKNIKLPKEGEKTDNQGELFKGDAFSLYFEPESFGEPESPTYELYRRIRGNPTVALARSIATSPVKSAQWTIASEDNVPDENVKFIQKQIDKIWHKFIRNIVYALDYGWQPFEIIWNVTEDNRFGIDSMKPLLVDNSKLVRKNRTSGALGVRNGDVELFDAKVWWFSYDSEAGFPYGRSRHENIRKTAWFYWDKINERRGAYARKTAGIVPIIEYPVGTNRDKDGTVKSNYELAKKVLASLGKASGVAFPNDYAKHASDLARAGVDLQQLKSWHISFLESSGDHGSGFTDMLRHLESLMMRGWLIPERTATEGQYGTKAESETHGTHAIVASDLLFRDILNEINQIINWLLIFNFGPEAEGSIWMEPGGLDPFLLKFYRELMEKVLSAPANIDLLLQWLDVDSMLDKVDLPKLKETVDNLPDGAEMPRGGDDGDDDENSNEKQQPQDIRDVAAAAAHRMNLRIKHGKKKHD